MIRQYASITGQRGSAYEMFIVDTGATHTIVSQQLAQRIGLKAYGSMNVMAANGTVTMPVAMAIISVGDAEPFSADVLISNQNINVLGVDVIQHYGLVHVPGGYNL